jgi:hypothetical protein
MATGTTGDTTTVIIEEVVAVSKWSVASGRAGAGKRKITPGSAVSLPLARNPQSDLPHLVARSCCLICNMTAGQGGDNRRLHREDLSGGNVSKKHVCMILLVLASDLALVSCGGGNGSVPLDAAGDCVKRTFPQCGPGTTPNVPAQN